MQDSYIDCGQRLSFIVELCVDIWFFPQKMEVEGSCLVGVGFGHVCVVVWGVYICRFRFLWTVKSLEILLVEMGVHCNA